jgi:glycosyltransferase involved in cell wall biosynthesis
MVVNHASTNGDARIAVIDTAPTWRSIHSNGIFVRGVGGTLQLLRDSFRLVRALVGRRFYAIHLTTSGHLAVVRDLVVAYTSTRFGVALVYHIRFGRIPKIAKADSLEWKLLRRVMLRAAKVVLIDQETFSAVRSAAPSVRAVLVPNCVDISSLPAVNISREQEKTVLFVGWVVPTKGVGELIEAWVKLGSTGWRLDIVGPCDRTYEAALVRRFAPEGVRFIGELSHEETMVRMARCDLFVLPSYTEGFPNVVAEAMALGRPIVATEVGAIPEMLSGDAGLLVKSKDPMALSEAMGRAMGDANLRRRIGDQALAKAKKMYSIDVVFGSYLQIWRSVSGLN